LAAIAMLSPHSMQVEKNGIVSQHDCSRQAILHGRRNSQRTLACSTQWRKRAFQNSIPDQQWLSFRRRKTEDTESPQTFTETESLLLNFSQGGGSF